MKKNISVIPSTIVSNTMNMETTIKIAASAAGCASGVIAVITAIVGAITTGHSRNVIADQIVSDILTAYPNLDPADIKKSVYYAMKVNPGFTKLDWRDRGPIAEKVIKKLEEALQNK